MVIIYGQRGPCMGDSVGKRSCSGTLAITFRANRMVNFLVACKERVSTQAKIPGGAIHLSRGRSRGRNQRTIICGGGWVKGKSCC